MYVHKYVTLSKVYQRNMQQLYATVDIGHFVVVDS